MELTAALELARELAASKEQHADYAHVVKLKKKYKILITGCDIAALLVQFVQREDAEMFAQRCALTIAITPAICSMLMNPFNRIGRLKIRKRVDFGDNIKNEVVRQMQEAFYGNQKSRNKGLEYYINRRFRSLSFTDPNAFIVTEWDSPSSSSEIIKPRPYEVSAEDAWNFEEVNEELKWLWVHNDITYTTSMPVKSDGSNKEIEGYESDGHRFTLYDEDYSIVLEQADPRYYTLQDGEEWMQVSTSEYYVQRVYQPKIGYVPAQRVGYIRDLETDERTMVNPFHNGLCYLMKTVKSVSEQDLTMMLHTFPQKTQYIERCEGVREGKAKKRCDMGLLPDGKVCTRCLGKGYVVHTSAQDAIYLPLPDDPKEMFDLDKLISYKAPPSDLLEFQDKYIRAAKADAFEAVFNNTTMVKASGSQDLQKTATEVNINLDSVYNTLDPYAEHNSEFYVWETNTFGILANAKLEGSVVFYIYPKDYKFKTLDMLLDDLKKANDSGAPSFMIDHINSEIAELVFIDDEMGFRHWKVKHDFFPYNGKSPDEIALLQASNLVSQFTKVLYANFEAIFTDIELEHPEFYLINNVDKQWEIVIEMVQLYIEDIASAAMDLRLGAPDAGSGNQDANNGGTSSGQENDNGGDPGQGDGEPAGQEGYSNPEE